METGLLLFVFPGEALLDSRVLKEILEKLELLQVEYLKDKIYNQKLL